MTVINIRRLKWLGHVIKMNKNKYVKISEGKLEGRRGKGRRRLRWINDVEDDLRKLGVKRWRAKASDREEWASIPHRHSRRPQTNQKHLPNAA